MAFIAVAVGGMAAAGAVGGAMKSGPDMNMYGRNEAQSAYEAYKNLVGKGPGEKDVANAYGAQTDFANVLGITANNGMYNSSEGARLAEMQFAPQRQALQQTIQDQMATANRAASAAGRSTNDPILRARLGADAMRMGANLSAQQSAAAMDLGRQSTMDMLSMRGQRVNVLQGLADTAFNNQNNLFNMGSQIQQLDMGSAQYEQSRGGGLKGALTGAVTGAGAGLQLATGFGNIANASKVATAQAGVMDSMSKAMPGIATNLSRMGANMTAPPIAAPIMAPQFDQSWFDKANATFNNMFTTLPPSGKKYGLDPVLTREYNQTPNVSGVDPRLFGSVFDNSTPISRSGYYGSFGAKY